MLYLSLPFLSSAGYKISLSLKLNPLEYPTWNCRSRSGGWHCCNQPKNLIIKGRTPKRACGFCLFPLPQCFVDGHRALEGAGGVYVAVDIRRSGDVAVPQPLLDQFHLHALCDKERRAGMAQVVKMDVLEAVLPQYLVPEFISKDAYAKDRANCPVLFCLYSIVSTSSVRTLRFLMRRGSPSLA